MIIAISGKIGSGKDTVGKIVQILTSQSTALDNLEVITDEILDKKIWFVITFLVKRFADKLKDMVCLLTNCNRKQLEDREFKEKELGEEWWFYLIPKPHGQHNFTLIPYMGNEGEYAEIALVKLTRRKIMQLLGTECGREIIHPNIWVNALMSEYKPSCKSYCARMKQADDEGCTCEQDCDCLPNWIITDMRFPNEMKAVKDRSGITIRVNRHGNYLKLGDYSTAKKEDIENVTRQVLKIEHESETALDDAKFNYVIFNNGTIKDLVEEVKVILRRESLI
jgi:hypothetical protein